MSFYFILINTYIYKTTSKREIKIPDKIKVLVVMKKGEP